MKWHVEGIIEWAVDDIEADTEAEARTKFAAKYSKADLAEIGSLEVNLCETAEEREEHAQSIKEAWDRLRDRGI